MTNQLVTKLETLAGQLKNNASAEIAAYASKLEAAARDLELKLGVWADAVEHWVETHFDAEAAAVREETGAAYRAAVVEAHNLHAQASTTTN